MGEAQWTQLISAGLGAAAGYLLKFYLDQRRSREERLFKDKRDHYRNLILCLKSFREGSRENLGLFWFEYSFLWLYAPDAAIRAANRLIDRMVSDPPGTAEAQAEVADLLLEIRRDLGFRNTSLQASDFHGNTPHFH